ncbi:hypothetical protein M758_4G211200 [Ceratodon purpureus]|nr:hypothetical protein M758_4G211200 [Ceratodon purpureus]
MTTREHVLSSADRTLQLILRQHFLCPAAKDPVPPLTPSTSKTPGKERNPLLRSLDSSDIMQDNMWGKRRLEGRTIKTSLRQYRQRCRQCLSSFYVFLYSSH